MMIKYSQPCLHSLEIIHSNYVYTCHGCKMEGIAVRYRCKKCGNVWHRECRETPTEIAFHGHECRFYGRPPLSKYTSCYACGKTIKGYVYHCLNTGFGFHPRCTRLRSQICLDGVTSLRLQKQGPSHCTWCKKNLLQGAAIPGWSYVSDYFNYHVYCVMEMPMVMMQSPSISSNGNNVIVVNANSANNLFAAIFGGLFTTTS